MLICLFSLHLNVKYWFSRIMYSVGQLYSHLYIGLPSWCVKCLSGLIMKGLESSFYHSELFLKERKSIEKIRCLGLVHIICPESLIY